MVMVAKPMVQLVDDIRGSDPAPSSGISTSHPIPVRAQGRLLVAVFDYQSGYDISRRTNVIGPPTRVRFFDPTTGAQVGEEGRAVVAPPGDERFGVPRSEYVKLLDDLCGSADVLLPAFANNDRTPTPEIKAAAKRYKHAFDRVCLKLLRPHYQEIGRDWFHWIDAAAAD